MSQGDESDVEKAELEEALSALEQLARDAQRGRPVRPDRYHARALLVPLGVLLRRDGAEELQAMLDRIRRVASALGEGWDEAARAELSLACAEHVHAVDPRYLDLSNYDFDYTLRARERLEARLLAAAELDIELPVGLLRSVRSADERLAPYVKKGRS